jgi:hypothetical protein
MLIRSMVLGFACLFLPALSGAQTQVPDEGMGAFGGEVGIYIPPDDDLDTGPTFGGFLEYYLTPRVGIRGLVGTAGNGVNDVDDVSLDHLRLLGTLLYNWERGKWHPFVGAGLGIYSVEVDTENDNDDDEADGTKAGFHLGGGIEYFVHRTVAVKGEALYHAVIADDDEFFGLDPSGLSLTIGLKKYF